MEKFPQYYTLLFRAAEDAIEALDTGNLTAARDLLLLIEGRQTAEEAFLAAGEAA